MLTVLIAAAEGADVSRVACKLGAAGHRVSYCHAPGVRATSATATSCAALAPGGVCPLELAPVDVVVAVKDHGHTASWPAGALCALRQGVPLVVCGPADAAQPPWGAADAQCDVEHLVAACARAVDRTGPTVRRALVRAVRRELTRGGQTQAVDVRVGQRRGALQVLLGTAPLPPRVRERVRGVVRAALAPYVQDWQSASVLFLDQLAPATAATMPAPEPSAGSTAKPS